MLVVIESNVFIMQYFQDRTERAGKPGKEDQPEAEMQRRVTSRCDIDETR